MPSHFTSWVHPSPAGMWRPGVASMGRMGHIVVVPMEPN